MKKEKRKKLKIKKIFFNQNCHLLNDTAADTLREKRLLNEELASFKKSKS